MLYALKKTINPKKEFIIKREDITDHKRQKLLQFAWKYKNNFIKYNNINDIPTELQQLFDKTINNNNDDDIDICKNAVSLKWTNEKCKNIKSFKLFTGYKHMKISQHEFEVYNSKLSKNDRIKFKQSKGNRVLPNFYLVIKSDISYADMLKEMEIDQLGNFDSCQFNTLIQKGIGHHLDSFVYSDVIKIHQLHKWKYLEWSMHGNHSTALCTKMNIKFTPGMGLILSGKTRDHYKHGVEVFEKTSESCVLRTLCPDMKKMINNYGFALKIHKK